MGQAVMYTDGHYYNGSFYNLKKKIVKDTNLTEKQVIAPDDGVPITYPHLTAFAGVYAGVMVDNMRKEYGKGELLVKTPVSWRWSTDIQELFDIWENRLGAKLNTLESYLDEVVENNGVDVYVGLTESPTCEEIIRNYFLEVDGEEMSDYAAKKSWVWMFIDSIAFMTGKHTI